LEHTVGAIHIPGTMDNLGEVENQASVDHNLLREHRWSLMDSSPLEVHNLEADRQHSEDMVDMQAGIEELLKGAKPENPIHARDRRFVDQQVAQ
jgi:hypothetical protein